MELLVTPLTRLFENPFAREGSDSFLEVSSTCRGSGKTQVLISDGVVSLDDHSLRSVIQSFDVLHVITCCS